MRVIENPSVELWDEVVSRSEYATFFHTPTWAQVVAQTYPHLHMATRAFVLDDGVVAIVPMVGVAERNRYFRWYQSVYPGVYGGAVAQRSLSPAEIGYIYGHLAVTRTSRIYIVGNPYADHNLPDSYSKHSEYTHVLSLDEGFDVIFKNYSKGHKANTKKAMTMGVEIGVAESEEDFRSYYEVYEDTLRRWGERTLVSYPYSLFEQIYRRRSESMRLWVAKVDGEIVSGHVVFYHNRHVVYWHGATRESYFSHRPGHLLTTEIIRDACQRGFRYYDFNPSGGLKNVEEFKERFGAQKMYFYAYEWQDNKLNHAFRWVTSLVRSVPNRCSRLYRNSAKANVRD